MNVNGEIEKHFTVETSKIPIHQLVNMLGTFNKDRIGRKQRNQLMLIDIQSQPVEPFNDNCTLSIVSLVYKANVNNYLCVQIEELRSRLRIYQSINHGRMLAKLGRLQAKARKKSE